MFEYSTYEKNSMKCCHFFIVIEVWQHRYQTTQIKHLLIYFREELPPKIDKVNINLETFSILYITYFIRFNDYNTLSEAYFYARNLNFCI